MDHIQGGGSFTLEFNGICGSQHINRMRTLQSAYQFDTDGIGIGNQYNDKMWTRQAYNILCRFGFQESVNTVILLQSAY